MYTIIHAKTKQVITSFNALKDARFFIRDNPNLAIEYSREAIKQANQRAKK